MADHTPRDLDAARALLRGLCRTYLDGGEAAVLAKLAECCKAIDASDGEPTGEPEDLFRSQEDPEVRGPYPGERFCEKPICTRQLDHGGRCMRWVGGTSDKARWQEVETPNAEPAPPPPLPMGAITEEDIERHVNSILDLTKIAGVRVALTCAPSAYQNGLSDHYYAEPDDEDEISPGPDAKYAWLRTLAGAGDEASMVRVVAYEGARLMARATLIFLKADGSPRKNSRGQYVIPLGKGAT